MLALTQTWPRWYAPAAVTAPLVLAAIGVPLYRAAGPAATIVLLAGGSVLLLLMLTIVANRSVRRAADSLRVGERALDTIPQAIFVVDALEAGQPNRYVNPAYAALTGYEAAEALGDGFDALTVFADPASVALLDGPLPAGATSRVDVRHRDGTTFKAKLELRAVPRGDGGRYVLGLLNRLDTAERSSDRRPGPRLEPVRSASEAPRAKDAFLSALSHDLRSPLNACVMWLDVLALAPAPDKLTQAVEAIKRNLARQTRLVNDLNDAARVASGGLEVRLAPLDLIALLKSHIDAWQLVAIGKQLTLQHRIEPATALIDGDAERLVQAFNHLLDSAIASTPAGGRIDLHVRRDGDACVVELADTGIALSADDAANVAVPLWRAAASAKARPGLGLGLAVAHHLVVRQGGTFTAASGGSGARFTLTLPLATADDQETAPLPPAERKFDL